MWFMPFKKKGTIICSLSKPSCRNSGAGPCNTTTTGPWWGIYITRRGLNKCISYITLHYRLLNLCVWKLQFSTNFCPFIRNKQDCFFISKTIRNCSSIWTGITQYNELEQLSRNFCKQKQSVHRSDLQHDCLFVAIGAWHKIPIKISTTVDLYTSTVCMWHLKFIGLGKSNFQFNVKIADLKNTIFKVTFSYFCMAWKWLNEVFNNNNKKTA